MMAVFDMVTAPTGQIAEEYSIATDMISDQYFSVDTADLRDVGEWVNAYKKGLAANDIYAIEMDATTRAHLAALSHRYGCFVGKNPWRDPVQ